SLNSNWPVIAFSAGEFHSLALTEDGSLWGMGLNNDGQLGLGYIHQTNQPQVIVFQGFRYYITSIAAGGNHSLFLKSDGSLWGMGLNNHGQLGQGTYSQTNNSPELIVAGSSGP